MDKEKNTGKSILAAGAATAFAGVTLYAVGQLLSFLFRDVDPKRKEEESGEEAVKEEQPEDGE